jgi:hemolysin activation/secretion protein
MIGYSLLAVNALAEETVIPRFEIRRFMLEGNTKLPADQLAKIFSEHIGKERDFADIQQTIEQLEQAYRKRGYTLVTVVLPEQELSRGEVLLQVIEPKVKEVKVEGNNHFSSQNILAGIPALKIGEIPKIGLISEDLRISNENPAKKMTLQFKAQDNPEDLQALVQVKDEKPWKLSLSGDNTGTSQSGYYRMGVALQHVNLWNLDHVAALQYITSPDHADKVQIVSGSYRVPLYSLGDSLDLFGGYSDVDNGTSTISGTNLTISGKGIVSGFRYNLSLPRLGAYEQKLMMGMDYRLYDNTVNLAGYELGKDVVAHPFSVTYGSSWQSEQITAEGYVGVLHNRPWGGYGQQEDFSAVRNSAKVDYWIFRYGFNKMLKLPHDWLVRTSGNGQYSPDRLVPGEQFGMGGATAVRGYEEREEAWDIGFNGSLELYSPDIAQLFKLPNSQFRLVGFFDGGVGSNQRAQSGELNSNSLKSVGTGFRLGIGKFFSFGLDWGYALDNSTTTRRGDSAVHFKGQLVY